MNITNNLKDDILHAPDWFHQAIQDKPEDKIFEHMLGNVSYSKWATSSANKNLIVLLHGGGAHKKWWDPIGPQIKEIGNIIAIDLPGMGFSDFREKYSIVDYGNCVTEIIEKEKSDQGLETVNIVGHSLGGHVAGYIATERKDLITNIIIIDTFIRPPDYDASKHRGPLAMIRYYPDKNTILNRFRLMPSQECSNDWYVRYIAEYSIKETKDGWRWRFDEVVFTSLERLFEYHYSFSCPVLFVHGANSLLTSGFLLENVKSMYGDIMEFLEIPGAAHHVPLDKPHEVIKLIKERCG